MTRDSKVANIWREKVALAAVVHLSGGATQQICVLSSGSVSFSALIQLMAAAEAGRDVAYFTFKDARLMTEVHKMHSFLSERRVTVGKTLITPTI